MSVKLWKILEGSGRPRILEDVEVSGGSKILEDLKGF
jgi:hypothetical protein